MGGSSAGMRCRVCAATVDVATPLSWRCPNATDVDRHHALAFVDHRTGGAAWEAFGAANGIDAAARQALSERLDAAVDGVAGVRFHVTPFGRDAVLSERLGFSVDGGVWVKDETGQVGGSHKSRHLRTILLHLLVAESSGLVPWREPADRPPLAIASCGNAAIAAATLAAAEHWPIHVFVPTWADLHVTNRLGELGAQVVPCSRREDEAPGDPCVHRSREAVAAGAVPFGVQGTENVWALDGGRTLGEEMASQATVDRVFIQVGGGALAACLADGLAMEGGEPRLHAVQTASSAPLVRAWNLERSAPSAVPAAARWSELMWPWESVGTSAADGILDDETYDWLAVIEALDASGGSATVVSEADVRRAHHLGQAAGIDVSATGTAGLAGLLSMRQHVADDERVAVVFSGVERT